jgi:hypothetical protein
VAAGARYAAMLILLGFNGCSRSVRPSIQRRGQLPLELRLLRPWFRDRGTLNTGLALAIARGWLWKHESGTYVKFTEAGAEAVQLL